MVTFTRLLRFIKWITFGVVVTLIVGALYQFVATHLDESHFPPTGQFIEVDGHNIHINCSGEGTPTVILEAGLGGGSLDWSLIQPEVARFGRVCSYDRAGIVWSSEDEGPRTASRITSELHKLLEAGGIAPPYVLVGHSMGGVYIQMFAARYADEVAGVVLVDSSHQDQLLYVPRIPALVPYLYKAAAPVGIVRLVNRVAASQPSLSPEANMKRARLYSHTHTVFTIADEMSAIPESLAELRAAPMRLGTKPLIVISRGLCDGASPETEAVWRELQSELLKSTSNGKHVIAKKSGHYIQFAEPELVTDSIRQLLNANENSR
jgi:pimeloyl-ACP methyl ester carboxylesterase